MLSEEIKHHVKEEEKRDGIFAQAKSKGVDFDAEMERIELAYLAAALRRTGGKKTAAAALLHIDPQRMKYLCRKRKLAAEG